ncbi:hypothetical protein [Duganella sp. sic0402]|uniref:hypothetical protein n=1 Tax=Duganella sp. sic0402 TaxID=2854786 RepID=UPI001E609B3F|nr:hypothetical protein [Duganella sp. sic0402]
MTLIQIHINTPLTGFLIISGKLEKTIRVTSMSRMESLIKLNDVSGACQYTGFLVSQA